MSVGTGAGHPSRVGLIGLYGMEAVGADGTVRPDERVAPWLPVVAEAAARLREGVPDGVRIEAKGPTVAVHWRQAPRGRAVGHGPHGRGGGAQRAGGPPRAHCPSSSDPLWPSTRGPWSGA